MKAFLIAVLSEAIAKGLLLFWQEFTKKNTAERELVTDEDIAIAERFGAAIRERMHEAPGDPESHGSSPALPPL